MIPATLPLPRTRQARLQSAMVHIASGVMSIRRAVAWSGISYSTPQSALQGQSDTPKSVAGRPRALHPNEELIVVGLLKRLAEERKPLRNEQVAEAIAIIVSFMAPARRLSLPFRDGRPGANGSAAFEPGTKAEPGCAVRHCAPYKRFNEASGVCRHYV